MMQGQLCMPKLAWSSTKMEKYFPMPYKVHDSGVYKA